MSEFNVNLNILLLFPLDLYSLLFDLIYVFVFGFDSVLGSDSVFLSVFIASFSMQLLILALWLQLKT